MTHVQEAHPSILLGRVISHDEVLNAVEYADFLETERKVRWGIRHLRLNDHDFFCCMQRDKYGVWSFWVYVVGTEEESIRYKCKIKVCCVNHSDNIQYEGQCISIHTSKQDVPEVGRPLTTTDASVKRFVGNDRLRVEWKVICI